MRGAGALALLSAALAGCPPADAPEPEAAAGRQRQAACELLLSRATALQGQGGESLRARGVQMQACLEWSDELRSCLLRGDLETPACAAAYAAQEGLVPSNPQRTGPPPRWSALLDEPLEALIVRPGGLVVGLTPGAVVGLSEGRTLWRAPLEGGGAGWLVDAGGGWLLAGTRAGALVCLEDRGGQERFRVALPQGAWAVEAARLGPRVLTLGNDGRLAWLAPDRCAPPGPGCLEPWRELQAAPPASVQPMRAGPGGLSLVTADERLHALEPTGRALFELEARRGLGEARLLPGERIGLVVDGQLAVLRPAFCRSRGPLRLGLPPQPEEGPPDLDVEHAPPPGCVASLVEVPGVAAFPPAPLPEGGLALVAGPRLLVLDGRAERWRTEVLPVSGPVASPHGQLYLLCAGALPDAPLRLRALSATTGLSLWLSETPMPAAAAAAGHRPLLVLDGDRLVVGLGPHLAAWDVIAARREGTP